VRAGVRGLGARVITTGARPDGTEHQPRCAPCTGALVPGCEPRADIGLAFDATAIVVTRSTRRADPRRDSRSGDLPRHLREPAPQGGVVVTTVMANLGLDQALAGAASDVKPRSGSSCHEEMQRIGPTSRRSSPDCSCSSLAGGRRILSGLQLLP